MKTTRKTMMLLEPQLKQKQIEAELAACYARRPDAARLGQDFVLRHSLKPLPGLGGQGLRQANHLRVRIHAQNKTPARFVPSVQMDGVRKIRVAANRHRPGERRHQVHRDAAHRVEDLRSR